MKKEFILYGRRKRRRPLQQVRGEGIYPSLPVLIIGPLFSPTRAQIPGQQRRMKLIPLEQEDDSKYADRGLTIAPTASSLSLGIGSLLRFGLHPPFAWSTY